MTVGRRVPERSSGDETEPGFLPRVVVYAITPVHIALRLGDMIYWHFFGYLKETRRTIAFDRYFFPIVK